LTVMWTATSYNYACVIGV